MTVPDSFALGECLHRLAKVAIDSGEVASIEEAMALFRSYSLHVHVAASVADSPAQQAMLLTAVNSARRAFLGGVTVSGVPSTPLLVAVSPEPTLSSAVRALGGALCDTPPYAASHLVIGGAGSAPRGAIRSFAIGWIAGCAPAGQHDFEDDPNSFVLAGIAAGAIGVAECFQQVRGKAPAAGRRRVVLSLWRPDLPYEDPRTIGMSVDRLPSSAWLIGLGNLGQAYLWSLAALPYARPGEVKLTLQDFDRIAPSNDSTSLLTDLTMLGRHKTRSTASWAERRGFETVIVERRFDERTQIGSADPAVALCGVDNALARSALEGAGFSRIIEAGLGGGVSDFLALRMHTFPGPRSAADIWGGAAAGVSDVSDKPAYRALEARGADKCGLVQLAGRTVGAPFVGALAGALVIAELVKLANGGPNISLLDLHLRTPDQLQAFGQNESFGFNPGWTNSAPEH